MIAAPVALGAAQTWTVNGTNPLTGGRGHQHGHRRHFRTGAFPAREPWFSRPPTPTPAAPPSTRGTLQLGDGVANNGSVTGNIADNGTLAFANCTAQTYSGSISGTGAINVTGSAALTLTGTSSAFSGVTTISAGTLQLGDGAANGVAGGQHHRQRHAGLRQRHGPELLRHDRRQRRSDDQRPGRADALGQQRL